MAAYMIFDIHVHDLDGYQPYRERAGAIIESYGGRYLVRGGARETVEGDWEPDRVVVIEFPSVEQAKTCYHSPEYQEILPIRQAASDGKAVLVEGA